MNPSTSLALTRKAFSLFALLLASTALAQQASLSLTGDNMTIAQTSNTDWSLSKTSLVGAKLETNTGVVAWDVTATRGATSANTLTLFGYLSIKNTGTAPASIGNIVVNLQRTVNKKWATASSDVANATLGDAATTALISSGASSEGKGSFTENAASGSLEFTDLSNNTLFAITPQRSIAVGEEVKLVFKATFNNSVLAIPAGESIRAEAIVTFGNVGPRGGSGASTSRLDINGNGVIDADEAYVRSVPTRYTRTVPALVSANSEVLVTDTGVTSTGTVTTADFNNGGIDTGALISATSSYTASVAADGGTDGGLVTNTAHLDGEAVTISLIVGYTTVTNPDGTTTTTPITIDFVVVPATHLQANSTVEIPGLPDNPPPPPVGFRDGDFFTFTQGGWGATPNGNNPAMRLANNFTAVFGAGFEVGIAGSGGYSMKFTSSTAVKNYLPAGGTPAALNTDLVNPTSSASGVFGGQVTALRINVAFSAAGATPVNLGVLKLTATGTSLDGLTVAQVLALCESALGGNNTSGLSIADLNAIATSLNEAFDNGVPTAWAQSHLLR